MDDALRTLVVVSLIAANAFLVVGEYAVVTARRSAVQALDLRGVAAALRLMDDPVRVISTVQVGITALGILTGAVGEPMMNDLLPEALPDWGAFVLGFAIITYLSVLLGELVPKALTLDRAERLVVAVAPPIELMSLLLKPIVVVLQTSAQLLLRPFGIRDVVAGDSIRSPEELRAIVDEAEGAGVIPRAQEELLHNVFDFPGREARDVMVPAADVVWLDADLGIDEALRRVVDCPFSRYPVGSGSLNGVVGVVHVRDLIAQSLASGAKVKDAMRSVPVVPHTKDLGALLRELREERQHLVVVADEYGGTVGILTMEDLLEELVGEIEDEYDLPDDRIERLDEHTVRVAGSMTVDDFNEMLTVDLPADGPHTIAGLVFTALGRKPEPGDHAAVAGARLDVDAVDGARITSVVVRLPRQG